MEDPMEFPSREESASLEDNSKSAVNNEEEFPTGTTADIAMDQLCAKSVVLESNSTACTSPTRKVVLDSELAEVTEQREHQEVVEVSLLEGRGSIRHVKVPGKPSYRFMDSSDDESEIELRPKIIPEKQATRKLLSSGSDDDGEDHNKASEDMAESPEVLLSQARDTSLSPTTGRNAKKAMTWSDSEEEAEKDASLSKKDKNDASESPKRSLLLNDDDSGSPHGIFRNSPDKYLKPRPERVSKKKALDEMSNLHKESQRLMRETKVGLPSHAPESMSFAKFFDLMKPTVKKFVSKKESFIDLCDDGDEEPAPPPPLSKLDGFINRFLKHAKPATVTFSPQFSVPAPLVKPLLVSHDVVTIPVVDLESASVEPDAGLSGGIPAKAFKLPAPQVARLDACQFDRLNKPGAKLFALKTILKGRMEDKMQVVIQRHNEEFKAIEEHRMEQEMGDTGEESDVEEEADLTDGEGDGSDTTESEPDEADIAGDDYGMDQKEHEGNEFGHSEAEEVDDEEVENSGDEEEELGAMDVDTEESQDDESDGAMDEDSYLLENDKLREAACDDDEDPLAGMGGFGEAEQAVVEDGSSNGSGHCTGGEHTIPPKDLPCSLARELDPIERDQLMSLCSFDNDNAIFDSLNSLRVPKTFSSWTKEKDILAGMDDAQERGELMNLLSCASGDFKTYVAPHPAGAVISEVSEHTVDDDDMQPLKFAGKKKPSRRRAFFDDDEDDNPREFGNSPSKLASDRESDDSEREDEEKPNPARTRVARIEESDSDDADDEEEQEEDDDIYEGGASHEGKFRNEEEEMEYLERQFNPTQKVKVSEFFEGEAEQSEDDYQGSGDENEDDLDSVRPEDIAFRDDRYYSMTKQQREAAPEYLRKIGEDDENLEEALKERFLHEDDLLPKLPSTSYGDGITFRLNMDGEVLEDDAVVEEDVVDNAWRLDRLAREQFMASNADQHKVDDDHLHDWHNPFMALSKQLSENADKSVNLQSESFCEIIGDGATTAVFKKTSILSRGSAVLARLNEVIDVEERCAVPQPILAMQCASTRKTLSLDGSSANRKVLRTESLPCGEPLAKRRRPGPALGPLVKKSSVFSAMGM